MKGAEFLVWELQRRGVSFLSTLCGHGLNPLLFAAQRFGLRVIDTRNEQTASYLADAYARLTRRVGVCAVSSGIAHVNAFSGLMNAWFDGAPLLLLSGASETLYLGRGAFQDVDQPRIARPLCTYSELVRSPDQLPFSLHIALTAAVSGRPGPVHLTVPLDVLNGEVSVPSFPPTVAAKVCYPEISGDTHLVREAVKALADAEAPLIVAGTETFYADAGSELLAFARKAAIPIVTPIWDRGVIDRPSPFFLGVIGAYGGEMRLLEDVDALLLVGVQVDYRLRYLERPPLRRDLRVIRIDIDPQRLHQGQSPDVGLVGNPKTVLRQLTEEWERRNFRRHQGWSSEARRRHRQFYARWAKPIDDGKGLNGSHIVHALREALTGGTVLLIDGGNIGQWAHFVLCADRYPSHWLTCGASAVVGWGIGGAMGARLAFPDRPVILLVGDGAIGFNIMDIESAVRQGFSFLIVLADDGGWGSVITGQKQEEKGTVASELGQVDYAAIARAMGAHGERIEDFPQISGAIKEAMSREGVTLLHVPIRVASPAEFLP